MIHLVPVLSDNYCYLVEREGRAIVVDPGDTEPVITALDRLGLEPEAVLLTHAHWDHVGGLRGLEQRWDSLYRVGPETPKLPPLDRCVGDGDTLECLGLAIQVIGTPGHSLADLSFYLPERQAVFCGDTLFVGGCGRLLEGDAQTMYDSLQKLKQLPPETRVYCGHEYTRDNFRFAVHRFPEDEVLAERLASVHVPSVPSTIGEELRSNVFLRAASVEEFASLRSEKDGFG